MGAPMPESLRAAMHRAQPDEWAIPCPGCGAKAGSTCRKPRGGVPPGGHQPQEHTMTSAQDPLADAVEDAVEHSLWQDLADAINRLEHHGICPLDGTADKLGVNAIVELDAGRIQGGGIRDRGYRLVYNPDTYDWEVALRPDEDAQ